jgi:hypothetical protein
MTTQDLKNKVTCAVQSFIDNDLGLLLLKVYEPSVSHRIAFYLERDFFNQDFHVDCEYDKRFDLEKPGPDEKPMRPDIVVHTRNQRANNQIVIEVKKTRSSRHDIEKLKILTRNTGLYKYCLGVFICFPNNEPIYKWFVDGAEINSY